MTLELELRLTEDLTPEQEQEIKEYMVIDEDFNREEYLRQHQSYRYEPFFFDISSQTFARRLDENHTVITTDTDMFVAHVPYELYASIYEELTGRKIKRLRDFDYEIEIEDFIQETESSRDKLSKSKKK